MPQWRKERNMKITSDKIKEFISENKLRPIDIIKDLHVEQSIIFIGSDGYYAIRGSEDPPDEPFFIVGPFKEKQRARDAGCNKWSEWVNKNAKS